MNRARDAMKPHRSTRLVRLFAAALPLLCIAAAISALAAAGMARGGIIVDQPPNQTGGPAADTDFISDSGFQTWQLLADDIHLSSQEVINSIVFFGFYGGDFDTVRPIVDDPPTGNEQMRIRFYQSRPSDGLPDSENILFEEDFLNPSRTATGRQVAVALLPDEYRYEVELSTPVILAANRTYRLELFNSAMSTACFDGKEVPVLLAISLFLESV